VTTLHGTSVRLRPATRAHIPDLVKIRQRPEVYRHWRGGDDLAAAVEEDFAEPGVTAYVIEFDDRVVGWIQWQAERIPTTGTPRWTSTSTPMCMAAVSAPTRSGRWPAIWSSIMATTG
jgi:hypothetical protein